MRRKTIKIGAKEVEVEVYDTAFERDGDMTAKAFHDKIIAEEEHDRKLASLAQEIAERIVTQGTGEKTIIYWEIGRLVEEYIMVVSKTSEAREHYQVLQLALPRLLDKLGGHLKDATKVPKKNYSMAYLLKWRRLAKKFSRAQAERQVPYSLAHELLYRGLSNEDVDMFLQRCEAGEFAGNMVLRGEVKRFIAEKSDQLEKSASHEIGERRSLPP